MKRTKDELLKSCIEQFEHIDAINDKEPLNTTKSLVREIKQAINYSQCCETVKDRYTHTFEVDLNSEKRKEQYNKQIEQIHNSPCKVYFYDGKNYIELKP